MAHRKSKLGRSSDHLESGIDHIEDADTPPSGESNKSRILLTVGLLLFITGAAYVERNVLIDSFPSVREVRKLDEVVDGSGIPPPSPPHIPAYARDAVAHAAAKLPPPPIIPQQKPAAAAVIAPVLPSSPPRAVAAADPKEEEEDNVLAILQAVVTEKTAAVRAMKFEKHLVMETDPEALAATHELQELCRKLVPLKYGAEPYVLEMHLKYPPSFPDFDEKGDTGVVQIEMAPLEAMPYSVLTFLDMVVHEWKGGAFHRNAGHVKQATIKGQNHKGFPLAFQEYSPKFPHSKYTLGFAGRPSSNAFYVSTMDNTYNHGPGSQGSKTEADTCFAKLVGAASKSGASVEAIKRLDKQPGAQKPNGFVSPASNHVTMESFVLLR